MASVIVGGLHKAQEAVRQATSKEKKVVDLERDTANIHIKQPLTTDHGVRVENTDQWLRVVDDQHTGPSLLEDQIAREKVSQPSSFLPPLCIFYSFYSYISPFFFDNLNVNLFTDHPIRPRTHSRTSRARPRHRRIRQFQVNTEHRGSHVCQCFD